MNGLERCRECAVSGVLVSEGEQMRTLIAICSAALITALVAGCVNSPNRIAQKSPEELASKATVTGTKFDSSYTIRSSLIDNGFARFFLRSWVDKSTGRVDSHQIYVHVAYTGDWIFYSRATAVGGQSIGVTQIDRDVSCSSGNCYLSEDFGIGVSGDFLQDHINAPLELRISSKNGGGGHVLHLPASYINGHMIAVENAQRAVN